MKLLKKIVGQLLYILFKIKRIFFQYSHNDKIVVLIFHKLGDTVFTIPSLKYLSYLHKNIIIFCFNDNKKILDEVYPNIKKYAFNKKSNFFKGIFAKTKVRKCLNLENPGTIYDLTGSIFSASIIFSSLSEKIIGFNEYYFKNLYSTFVEMRTLPHLADLYMDVITNTNVLVNYKEFKSFTLSYDKTKRNILIHPFASWVAKEWGLEKFIELGRLLNKMYNVTLCSEHNLAIEGLRIESSKNIEEFISLIKRQSFVIGCDSAAVHLAAMLGKPTFTIFGPTNPDYSYPLNYGKFIINQVPCSPLKNQQYCHKNAGREGCNKFICMEGLSVERVYLELEKYLKEVFE